MLTRLTIVSVIINLFMLLFCSMPEAKGAIPNGGRLPTLGGQIQVKGNTLSLSFNKRTIVFTANEDGSFLVMTDQGTEQDPVASVKIRGEYHDIGFLTFSKENDEWIGYSIQHDESYPLDDHIDTIDLGFGRLFMDYPVIGIKTNTNTPSMIFFSYTKEMNTWFIGEIPF